MNSVANISIVMSTTYISIGDKIFTMYFDVLKTTDDISS